MQRLEEYLFWILTSAVTGLLGGVSWLVRVVLTNQQQIEMMRAEIKHRDQLRAEDREDLSEVKDSVKRIEKILMGDYHDER